MSFSKRKETIKNRIKARGALLFSLTITAIVFISTAVFVRKYSTPFNIFCNLSATFLSIVVLAWIYSLFGGDFLEQKIEELKQQIDKLRQHIKEVPEKISLVPSLGGTGIYAASVKRIEKNINRDNFFDKCFEESAKPKNIDIIGISLRHIRESLKKNQKENLIKKINDGGKIRILILDPDGDMVWVRAREDKGGGLKELMPRKLCDICPSNPNDKEDILKAVKSKIHLSENAKIFFKEEKEEEEKEYKKWRIIDGKNRYSVIRECSCNKLKVFLLSMIIDDLEDKIFDILKDIESENEIEGSFECGFYNTSTYCHIIRTDEKMLLTNYLYDVEGDFCPTFLIDKSNGEDFFDKYMAHFNYVWKSDKVWLYELDENSKGLLLIPKEGIFKINLQIQKDLDNGIISSELRKEFSNNKRALLNNARSLIWKSGSKWLINDDEREYLIKKEGNELNIYNILRISKE